MTTLHAVGAPDVNDAAERTWFRDPVGGTYYPSIESARRYLPEGRTVEPASSPTLEITTVAGVTYKLYPVWMDRLASAHPEDWLRFQGQHVLGTALDEATQDRVQRFMREHRTECLTNHNEYFTLAGGMLALCDPTPFQERKSSRKSKPTIDTP